MRKPQDITIDRTLLVYGLSLAQEKECSMVSDVKVQQLIFLAELQMFGKGVRGLHYEFMRFPYGAFSKDLDNDLLALRKKERLQNFDVVGPAEECVPVLDEEVTSGTEVNQQVMEILQSVVETYGPQEVGEITKSVEDVEISVVDRPEEKLCVRDIPFHSIVLVPSRIEVTGDFSVPAKTLALLNKALGS
ncbi:MAG: hypothetical protein OXF97_04475 [Nitrospira sp.]|nr:hypothetical protein [Nitrospira sp.]MCY3954595.1 hypothetical protein [Nitrospira sp.]MCY4133007.1 hypothetical protein [Nitrospira sp.]